MENAKKKTNQEADAIASKLITLLVVDRLKELVPYLEKNGVKAKKFRVTNRKEITKKINSLLSDGNEKILFAVANALENFNDHYDEIDGLVSCAIDIATDKACELQEEREAEKRKSQIKKITDLIIQGKPVKINEKEFDCYLNASDIIEALNERLSSVKPTKKKGA